MDCPKTPILTHEDIDVIRRYNAIMDRPDVQEFAKYHATENRMNGVLEGVSSGKGGRAWLDGEWQLVELTALACHIRAVTKEDGGIPDDFARELIQSQPDYMKILDDLCDLLKPHGPIVTGTFVKDGSDWIGRFDSPIITVAESIQLLNELLNELGRDVTLHTALSRFATNEFSFCLRTVDKFIRYSASNKNGGCGVFRSTLFSRDPECIVIPIGNTLYSDMAGTQTRVRVSLDPEGVEVALANGKAIPDWFPADTLRDVISDYFTRHDRPSGVYHTGLSGKPPFGYLVLTPVEKK